MHIAPLAPNDRPQWQKLAEGYKLFYQSPTPAHEYEAAWEKLLTAGDCIALGAKTNGELVGFAHALFHTSVWAPKVCYLQDLFTDAHARGQGVATALINAVAAQANQQGAARLYWLTQTDNHVARSLYDRLAQHHGFIRYDFDLA